MIDPFTGNTESEPTIQSREGKEIDGRMRVAIARQISPRHIKTLAVGYLGMKAPQFDTTMTDNKGNMMNANIAVLSKWIDNNPHSIQKLHGILCQVGTEHGLVSATVLHILKSKYQIYLCVKYFAKCATNSFHDMNAIGISC